MPSTRLIVFSCSFVLCLCSGTTQAQSITSITPRTIKPGTTTELTVTGKGFDGTLRFLNNANAATTIESVESEKAVIKVSVAKETPLGPIGLWAATHAGSTGPAIVLVDDLNVVSDNGKNHSLETAQSVPATIAVDGVSDGTASDYYRIQVEANQRIAVEAMTQCLDSAMDPVIRLLAADGSPILIADDDGVGPECRFSRQFETAGDYVIEIRDSGYVAGGTYHLRMGDFPLVTHCFPLAAQRGQTTSVGFATLDQQVPQPSELTVSDSVPLERQNVACRLTDGQVSTWRPIHVSPFPQYVEGEDQPTLEYPLGINGQFTQAGQQDQYVIRGSKDQTVRFQSRTRSLGSLALLKMQLLNAEGQVVAESKVTDADEWSFDYKFPDNGEFRLTTSDLLGRGGIGYGYLVEAIPTGTVQLGFKADAKLKEEYLIEPKAGACALDLQVDRFGYDGEITLSLSDPSTGLRILNPVIPAKAKTAKIYLTTDQTWQPGHSSLVRLRGTAAGNPNLSMTVNSLSLHRTKRPHIPFPDGWRDGMVLLSGTADTDGYYSLEPDAPLQFARQQAKHLATVVLKRTDDKFKAGVSMMARTDSGHWQVAAKPDKDNYQLTLTKTEQTGEPDAISLLAYSEFNGRGHLKKTTLPVEWIDPITLGIEASQPLVAGKTQSLKITVDRQGNDPQPVTVTFPKLPAGWSTSETVTIAADQNEATFELTLPADNKEAGGVLHLQVSSQFRGQDLGFQQTLKAPPVATMPERIAVHPAELEMHGKSARRQLIVTGFDAQTTPRDWTRDATITCRDPRIAEVRRGVVHAKSDGETELLIQVGVQQFKVPVRVQATTQHRNIGFESEVLVALSKQGCNSGACHGSPSGKGMFRLSLRGFDQKLDRLTLIREDFGRRINRMEPEKSLVLQKPLMKVSHGGGKQLKPDDAAYAILRTWIAEGGKADPAEAPRCVRLEVYPTQKRILSLADGQQQLSVLAHFSDGTTRDVTELVVYESSNQTVAKVDEHGWIQPEAQGETVILVRFLEHIESIPFMFVQHKSDFKWAAPEAANYIDRLVNEKLRQIQYLPSGTCNDSEFLRRSYLDVIGILPTIEESRTFLDDTATDKRARLIDRLLERDEYAKFWALKWGDLLKMTSQLVGKEGVHKYHRWVEEAFRQNMPYDEFARALLSADGSTWSNPPANFYRTATNMNDCVETVSQVFLGARLQCAKCHNHPFERWTQDNYYGLGAFFQRVQRRKTQRPGEMFVWTAGSGEVTQPRTGQQMQPWLPVAGTIKVADGGDRRDTLVDWLVKVDNPYFAKIEANRIWSECFARGIVEPVDDFRDSNPPSNGPLLDALAKDFAEHGFDRKHLLRRILNSRTYQASYEANESNREDQIYFSHQLPRLMSAEQLLDAINHATGLQETLANLPAGTKATQLPAPDLVKLDFLKVFGQPERSTVCACERTDDSNLGMAIELFNGPTIHKKLQENGNRFRNALEQKKSPREIVDQLYLAAVCRLPTDFERNAALEHCSKRETIADGLADVCWALLNTDEFIFQH